MRSKTDTGEISLKLPKVRKPVELLMLGDLAIHGEVYLLPPLGPSPGETVLDLISSPERFLPLACLDGRRLVNKEQIMAVRVPDRNDAGVPDEESATRSSRVMIELAGPRPRRKISGTARWTPRADRPRFVDHVNETQDWLALEDPEGQVLVACRHILNLYS